MQYVGSLIYVFGSLCQTQCRLNSFEVKIHIGWHHHPRGQTTGGATAPPRTPHHHVQADEGARGK